jgi:hypothetical protein
MMLAALAGVLAFGIAEAADKPSACPDQLMVEQTVASIVSQKRGEAERQIADLAVRVSGLQAKVQALVKENGELKAKLEPKAEDEAK